MPAALLWAIVGAAVAAAGILGLALIGLGAWRHREGRLDAEGYDRLERAPVPLPRGGGARHACPPALSAVAIPLPPAPLRYVDPPAPPPCDIDPQGYCRAGLFCHLCPPPAPLRYVDPPAPRPEGDHLGAYGERYLPTYPGSRMQIFNDGTVEFTDPETGAPVGPWELSPEAAALRAFIAEVMGENNGG